jgi:hypothetical protein
VLTPVRVQDSRESRSTHARHPDGCVGSSVSTLHSVRLTPDTDPPVDTAGTPALVVTAEVRYSLLLDEDENHDDPDTEEADAETK